MKRKTVQNVMDLVQGLMSAPGYRSVLIAVEQVIALVHQLTIFA